jgi:hypothetical protein
VKWQLKRHIPNMICLNIVPRNTISLLIQNRYALLRLVHSVLFFSSRSHLLYKTYKLFYNAVKHMPRIGVNALYYRRAPLQFYMPAVDLDFGF